MDTKIQSAPAIGYPFDSDDAKCVSGLSTILVATIQEAKDRISQIEYVFCSQLYPNFQTKCKSFQKIYSEAKKSAEDTWKERENDLLFKIKKLQLEKEKAIEENQSVMVDMTKSLKEEEEKTTVLLGRLKSQQSVIDKLERELMEKCKEVDQGIELQNKLIQSIQSKTSVIVNTGKRLQELEDKTNVLLAEMNSLEKKIGELQKELGEKNEEIAKEKALRENLFRKIEMQASEIINNENLLSDYDKEKQVLMTRLEHLEQSMSKLQQEVRRKSKEVEEGSQLHKQLVQRIESSQSELMKNRQQLEDCEGEKILVLSKVKFLEEKVHELNASIRERSHKAAEERDIPEKLLQQIKSKSSELLAEKKKRRDVVDAYKRLKSQYNFLCTKFGLTMENIVPQSKSEDQSNSVRHHPSPLTRPENNNSGAPAVAYDKKVKIENSSNDDLEDEKREIVVQTSSCNYPVPNLTVVSRFHSNEKSAPVAGKKRRASGWIDTRSRQCQVGPDPHDDFLDTPLEEVRGNLAKTIKEVGGDPPVAGPKDANIDGSDDETQDMSAELARKEQMANPTTAKGSFKCVETVRKKAERANLKGFECKQCKKFYDAVLPENGGKDTDSSKQGFRCEHHDGVSRHRYKYAPPMTPEGFWNIGFESEM